MVSNESVESTRREEISHDHLFRVTGLSSSNLEKLEKDAPAHPEDFEAAIAATGTGWFNALLLLCSVPAFISAVTVTSSVSYIFTRANCDMELTLVDMGTVNAITYAGMISSAMVWGYLSDTLGRRHIMIWGFLAAGVLETAAALSQTFPMLLVTRFFCGFLFNGPFAVLLSYMAEMYCKELRTRMILLTNLFFSTANTLLPVLAWSILMHDWELSFFEGKFVIHTWNIFLLATAVLPLLSGVAFFYLPESPKFLMSRGRNEEAMKVFKRLYVMNNPGKTEDDYPIKSLVQEKSEEQARGAAALRAGLAQIAPLFRAPHGKWLLLICVLHAATMLGANTLRLWYPQLTAMLGSSGSLCEALTAPAASTVPEECHPIETSLTTYLQSAVVGAGSFLTFSIGSALVNYCGKRLVTGACAVGASLTIVLLPFLGLNAAAVLAIMAVALSLTALCGASMSSITVELFPTSLRVMAMAIFLMFGRLGTIAGTVSFPALVHFGCLPPFIMIAAIMFVCGVSCTLLPNTTLKRLE